MATILLVDDEDSIRFVMGCVLSGSHNVIEAANGQEGLAKCLDYQPEIVITDLNMPGMTGLELIKEIRRINPGIKIIATTGSGFLSLAESSQVGADVCLSKPISIGGLEEAIRQLLSK